MVELKPKGIKGKVIIATDVISKIAATAAMEVDGVASPFDSQFALAKKYPKRQYRWVKVNFEDKLDVTVKVQIKNGYKIIEVSKNIQKKVKNEIETMTGINVSTVNVVALGVIA